MVRTMGPTLFEVKLEDVLIAGMPDAVHLEWSGYSLRGSQDGVLKKCPIINGLEASR